MAKKDISRYKCSECGFISLTLVGKCPKCGEWGTMEEEAPIAMTKQGSPVVSEKSIPNKRT